MSSKKIADLNIYGGISIEDYETYEHFLDSMICKQDLVYIEDINMVRKLYELGFMTSTKEELNRDEFYRRKADIAEMRRVGRIGLKTIISEEMNLEYCSMLTNLKVREAKNKFKEIHTIVFISDYNEKGVEVSGYIDLAHRMATENFELIFQGKKKLLPQRSDLSFCNLKFLSTSTRDSPNWKVISESSRGMQFLNLKDKKIMQVDPHKDTGDGTTRARVKSPDYKTIIFFDHHTRVR